MTSGLVTTVPISHATPASWFSHDVDRFNYLRIGEELLLATRPEVILGGGVGPNRGNFVSEDHLHRALASDRWLFVERTSGVDGNEALSKAARAAFDSGRGLLGIFGNAAGNWESPVARDQPSSPEVVRGNLEDPGLAQASLAALEVLSRDPDGFFLLVEQGDIDWSNHANDFARMIGCVWDLHEAVRAIVTFVDRTGDQIDWSNTTVLVTADHANSYMRLERPLTRGDLPLQTGVSGAFAYPGGEVSYGTTQHTGELVTLNVRGFAADKVASYQTAYPGLPIVDNTAIYRLTLDAAQR
jgi:alkaline phosphatase